MKENSNLPTHKLFNKNMSCEFAGIVRIEVPKYLKFRTVEKVIMLVICNLIYVDLFIRIASH